MPTLESAIADCSSGFGTSSGVSAAQAGAISAEPMPSAAVSPSSSPGVIAPVSVVAASAAATSAIQICTPIRKRRRSTMSDSAPAGSASTNIGAAPAACTSDTSSGLGDSVVISQPAPTSCIQVPMFDAIAASHSQRKVRWRSGLQALAGAPAGGGTAASAVVASAVVAVASELIGSFPSGRRRRCVPVQNAKHEQPNAPQKPCSSPAATGTAARRARSWAWPCTAQAPRHWCGSAAAGGAGR